MSDRQMWDKLAQQRKSSAAPKEKVRGSAKRNNPDYAARSFYLPKATDRRLQRVLLDLQEEGYELDRSELLNCLLTAWLDSRQGSDLEHRLAELLSGYKPEAEN